MVQPADVGATKVDLGADAMMVTITIDSTDFVDGKKVSVVIAAGFAADKAAPTANNNVEATLEIVVAKANAAPGAPAITTTTPGDGKVTLVWTAPSNTGITGGDGTTGVITKYTVYHSESTITDLTATGVTAVEVTGATTLTKEVTGLNNGTQYFFKVTATNATGEGAASTATSATPVPADVAPGTPTGVTATAGDEQVTVAWAAPTDTGYISGDGTMGVITAYTVYHSETNDFTDLTAQAVTSVNAWHRLDNGRDRPVQWHTVLLRGNSDERHWRGRGFNRNLGHPRRHDSPNVYIKCNLGSNWCNHAYHHSR